MRPSRKPTITLHAEPIHALVHCNTNRLIGWRVLDADNQELDQDAFLCRLQQRLESRLGCRVNIKVPQGY